MVEPVLEAADVLVEVSPKNEQRVLARRRAQLQASTDTMCMCNATRNTAPLSFSRVYGQSTPDHAALPLHHTGRQRAARLLAYLLLGVVHTRHVVRDRRVEHGQLVFVFVEQRSEVRVLFNIILNLILVRTASANSIAWFGFAIFVRAAGCALRCLRLQLHLPLLTELTVRNPLRLAHIHARLRALPHLARHLVHVNVLVRPRVRLSAKHFVLIENLPAVVTYTAKLRIPAVCVSGQATSFG